MIENRLILLLKKTKSLTQKLPSSNSREWKTFSTPLSEHQSRFYSSFPRFLPASEHLVARGFIGYGLRSFLLNNRKKLYKRSFRNFSTSTSVDAKTTEGLKLLVTAGPKAQEAVGTWLFVSAAWLYSMVVLGGVSRLAKSGLSMTDWKFTGQSNDDWLIEFEKYKQSSEYKRRNKEISLDDFKFMYWMEYAHHLWGRALGIMFVVPFSYFLSKGYITRRLGLRLSGLFALGAGQGLIGWWMAKSRLEESVSEYAEPRVSLYCFAAHLASAFALYSGLFWTAVSVVMPDPPAESIAWVQGASKVKRLLLPVTILVGITSVSGAFVAGNDDGPKMDDAWVLDEDNIYVLRRKLRNFFENTSTAQVVYGILSAASVISVGGLWWSLKKLGVHPKARPLIGSTIGIAAVQVALGTSSLVSNIPITLGTAHQCGTLTLLTLIILLNHIVRRTPLHGLPSVAKTAL
ncbi:hypothetical protein ACS0TY_000744 [Phlomoides rotata]